MNNSDLDLSADILLIDDTPANPIRYPAVDWFP